MAAAAIAVTVASSNRFTQITPPAKSHSLAAMLPESAAPADAQPQSIAGQQPPATQATLEALPPPVTEPASATASDVSAESARSGQIWECRTNGVRTFSNNPCGDKSALRGFGPINTMAATPVLRVPRSFQPEPGYAENHDYPATQDYADDSYASAAGIPSIERGRGERVHRPSHHMRRPLMRKN